MARETTYEVLMSLNGMKACVLLSIECARFEDELYLQNIRVIINFKNIFQRRLCFIYQNFFRDILTS